jgi:hypothetical protein
VNDIATNPRAKMVSNCPRHKSFPPDNDHSRLSFLLPKRAPYAWFLSGRRNDNESQYLRA